jgi:GT2 family glycosyltransferase
MRIMSERPAILIPAHNRRALTLACLERLLVNGDLAACEAVVIDDGSSDGTSQAVLSAFPAVRVLRGDGHLYWTGAICLAMEDVARRGNRQPVFWLNEDVRPQPGALTALREYLEKNPSGIAGPRCVDHRSGETVPTGFIGRVAYGASQGEVRPVQGLSGFCVGLGSQAWSSLGRPDAGRFPHYAGDTAYTLHASRAGHPVVLLGSATVELLDHRPLPLNARLNESRSFRDNWHHVFSTPASPYRLRTLLALQRLKYGPVVGTLLASLRAAKWVAQLASAYVHRG